MHVGSYSGRPGVNPSAQCGFSTTVEPHVGDWHEPETTIKPVHSSNMDLMYVS
ncbi:unnamed protein product [Gulo gulo]|uniref:Uncharacterized protein n=1 Tax=Gulo gulo TaxID=48420 RepID=A0A9X9M403_GULGU|nr:unnamed protein product [Gulo gulo]